MEMTAGNMALTLGLEIGALRRDDIDEKEVASLEQSVTRVAGIVAEFGKSVEQARASGKFTVSGLREFIDTHGKTARTAIAAVATRVDYATRIDQVKKKLAAVPLVRPKLEEKRLDNGEVVLLADPQPQPNPLYDLQVQQEIRSLLRALDPVFMWSKLVDAIVDNDINTILAIELAPRSFPLLKQEQLAEGLKLRQRRAAPILAKQLDDLERLEFVWNDALAMSESCLTSAGVPPAVDEIAKVAEAAA